jgi:hypothetical protein
LEPKLLAIAKKAQAGQMGSLGDDAGITSLQPQLIGVDPGAFDLTVPAGITSAIDASTSAPASSTFSDIVSSLATAWGATQLSKQQLNTQQQITNIQLQRAQAGLPPLNIDTAGLGLPGINVGVSSSTQNTILLFAAILGGAFIIPKLFKR